MAGQITGARRRELAALSYERWVQRVPFRLIAEELDVSRQLAANLAREEQERLKDEASDEERAKAIATYEAVIRHGFGLLLGEDLKANSLNQSGVMNSITTAQRAIDDITGAKAPTKSESDVNVNYRDYTTGPELEELFAEIDGWLVEGDGEAGGAESLDTEQAGA